MAETVIQTRQLTKEFVRDEFRVVALKDVDITIERNVVTIRAERRPNYQDGDEDPTDRADCISHHAPTSTCQTDRTPHAVPLSQQCSHMRG